MVPGIKPVESVLRINGYKSNVEYDYLLVNAAQNYNGIELYFYYNN